MLPIKLLYCSILYMCTTFREWLWLDESQVGYFSRPLPLWTQYTSHEGPSINPSELNHVVPPSKRMKKLSGPHMGLLARMNLEKTFAHHSNTTTMDKRNDASSGNQTYVWTVPSVAMSTHSLSLQPVKAVVFLQIIRWMCWRSLSVHLPLGALFNVPVEPLKPHLFHKDWILATGQVRTSQHPFLSAGCLCIVSPFDRWTYSNFHAAVWVCSTQSSLLTFDLITSWEQESAPAWSVVCWCCWCSVTNLLLAVKASCSNRCITHSLFKGRWMWFLE